MKSAVSLLLLSLILSLNPLAGASSLGAPGPSKPLFSGMSKPWAKAMLKFKRAPADLRGRHAAVFKLLSQAHFAPIVTVLIREKYTHDSFGNLEPLAQAALIHRLLPKASEEVLRVSEETIILATADGLPLPEVKHAQANLDSIIRSYAAYLPPGAAKDLEAIKALSRVKTDAREAAQIQESGSAKAAALASQTGASQAPAAVAAPASGRQALRYLERLKKSGHAHSGYDVDLMMRLEDLAAASRNPALQKTVSRGLAQHMLSYEDTRPSAAAALERIADNALDESVSLLAVESLMDAARLSGDASARGLIAAVERIAVSSPSGRVKARADERLREYRNNPARLPYSRVVVKNALSRIQAPPAAASKPGPSLSFKPLDGSPSEGMSFKEVPAIKDRVERLQKGLSRHPAAAALVLTLTSLLAGFLIANSFPAAGLALLLPVLLTTGLAALATHHPVAAMLQTAMASQFYALVSAFDHVHGAQHAPGLIVAGLVWSGISLWSYLKGRPVVGLILNAALLTVLAAFQLLV